MQPKITQLVSGRQGVQLESSYTRTDILNNNAVLLEGLDRKGEEMKIWVIIMRFRMDRNQCGKH